MPSLFDRLSIRGMELKNRVMMAPMCMYSAEPDGKANQWHKTHYGARAVGGTGLIMLEATAIESRGRLSNHDLGLWSDDQIEPLQELISFCHQFGAKVGVQIAHGGRKSWGGEKLVAPSAIPFREGDDAPHELTVEEIEEMVDKWTAATRRAVEAGFDCVELHGAHGYLLNQFLSPVANKRTDQYGGSAENRMRFPLEVTRAVRQVIGDQMPLFYRVSAVDHVPEGIQLDDMVDFVSELEKAGVDLIDVSSGGVAPVRPTTYPGYQVDYARKIREQTGLPTGAVGLITEPEFGDAIVQNEWADLLILGRELLRNPHWTLYAAAELGKETEWPEQYSRAKI